jgi:hypothetical protein
VDWNILSDAREYEIITEDPVAISDGLAVSQSASLYISKNVSPSVAGLISQYMAAGYIKVKVHKLKKRRDWIKL